MLKIFERKQQELTRDSNNYIEDVIVCLQPKRAAFGLLLHRPAILQELLV